METREMSEPNEFRECEVDGLISSTYLALKEMHLEALLAVPDPVRRRA
jgi:hypothetical protein